MSSREHTILLFEALGCDAGQDLAAALATAPGVIRVYVDMACETIFVEHRSEQSTRADIGRIVELNGLRVRISRQ